MSHVVISDEHEAARWGMHGSPTLLIDGIDQFPEPGQLPSMSCRLYRDDYGTMTGTPSTVQLRRVIGQARTAAKPEDTAWLDSLGRTRRGRIAPAERGLRAVHQAVLRSLTDTGRVPDAVGLARHAEPFRLSQVLAELADGDFFCLGSAGQITAAYPFSALPTPHLVRITGAATVFAMCAIDALGVSAMTGRPVTIESADPGTGQPVTVQVDGTVSKWHPATAVVYVGRTRGHSAGPSATVCCGSMNFFSTRAAASAWAATRPDITGGVLDQARALQAGIDIFGQLLQ